MSKLAPLALTIGTFLIGIGLTDAIAADLAHRHDHLGQLVALLGMVGILAGVLVQAARPHRSIRGS
jgi:uncharacterized membrane protein HdeD (DUF308 family)